MHQEATQLRRLLWINTGLDALCMIGGLFLIRTKGHNDRQWWGQGLGIIIQGRFLFVFDLIHALLVPKKSQEQFPTALQAE